MAVQFVFPGQQRVDANGAPLANYRLYFYEPGTTTPKDVYSDDELSTAVSQTSGIAADASGVWPRLYMSGKYKVVLKTSADVDVTTWDDFDPGLSTALGSEEALPVAGGGTGATTAAAARNNLGAASQASVTTNTSNITELQTQVATGLNGDDEFGDLAALDEVSRDELEAGFGVVILQRVRNTTIADSSVTTATPALDNSIPQISEGEKIFETAFTPVSATSKVIITVNITATSSDAGAYSVAAVFKDATAASIGADVGTSETNSVLKMNFSCEDTPGSTTPITYTVRIGTSSGTLTLPGTNNLGGMRKCYVDFLEIETI